RTLRAAHPAAGAAGSLRLAPVARRGSPALQRARQSNRHDAQSATCCCDPCRRAWLGPLRRALARRCFLEDAEHLAIVMLERPARRQASRRGGAGASACGIEELPHAPGQAFVVMGIGDDAFMAKRTK